MTKYLALAVNVGLIGIMILSSAPTFGEAHEGRSKARHTMQIRHQPIQVESRIPCMAFDPSRMTVQGEMRIPGGFMATAVNCRNSPFSARSDTRRRAESKALYICQRSSSSDCPCRIVER